MIDSVADSIEVTSDTPAPPVRDPLLRLRRIALLVGITLMVLGIANLILYDWTWFLPNLRWMAH